jgi:hypothetical protein
MGEEFGVWYHVVESVGRRDAEPAPEECAVTRGPRPVSRSSQVMFEVAELFQPALRE